jgi:hypothetical protein
MSIKHSLFIVRVRVYNRRSKILRGHSFDSCCFHEHHQIIYLHSTNLKIKIGWCRKTGILLDLSCHDNSIGVNTALRVTILDPLHGIRFSRIIFLLDFLYSVQLCRIFVWPLKFFWVLGLNKLTLQMLSTFT